MEKARLNEGVYISCSCVLPYSMLLLLRLTLFRHPYSQISIVRRAPNLPLNRFLLLHKWHTVRTTIELHSLTGVSKRHLHLGAWHFAAETQRWCAIGSSSAPKSFFSGCGIFTLQELSSFSFVVLSRQIRPRDVVNRYHVSPLKVVILLVQCQAYEAK